MTTLPFVVATAFALVVFVMITNVVVDLYARGAVRAAVDEAARAGARVDAGPGECAARATQVLDGLVGRRLRSAVAFECVSGGRGVTARADVVLPSWLALIPSWRFTVAGTAVKEQEP